VDVDEAVVNRKLMAHEEIMSGDGGLIWVAEIKPRRRNPQVGMCRSMCRSSAVLRPVRGTED
jgi:hypothetical protein